ncbi:terminase large subunit domain-containing protein [Klebsiella variicola]|uniref:terminase large subunit domain-containing protein n=2 Tax=Klebsiella variicola TaxID=244366 RepID=UPI0034C67047
MATYPNVNAANQYARDIVGGKILACQLTILACQRHLDDLERAKDPHWPYRFDKNKAERFLRFAQKMPHTSGEWARRKLRIEFEAWQKFALGVPFGWVHKKTGLRRFSEIYIEVPRKNGKSAIAAAVGNYMFCADGEHGAEVYCGATTEKQAWKVFSPALQMVKKLPALRQKFSIKPWAKKMTRPDGSVFAPVIGDPGDGDSPSCAIIDEYHEHTTDALYTTMTTGTFDDILVIGTDNQTTLPGGLSAGGNIDNTSKGKVLTQAIELSMSTPYIDFHYNGSSADYTARLIHDRQNRLNAQVQSFWVTDGRITASSTMPANPAIGTQLTSSPVRSLMAGRGAYGDVDGAYVQMYMEEQVGTEHRLVLYADGFGRTDAWIFRAGGTISTGKGDVLTTGSDVRLKEDFTESQEGASRRINALGVCEFNMKGETRRRRGFIAQQAEKVDDLYTFPGIEQEIDGEKFRVMNVDYTAIIADLVTVVQDLIRRVDDLES